MGYETRVVVVVPAFDISIRTFPNGHLNRLSESLLESPWKKESKEKEEESLFWQVFLILVYKCIVVRLANFYVTRSPKKRPATNSESQTKKPKLSIKK